MGLAGIARVLHIKGRRDIQETRVLNESDDVASNELDDVASDIWAALPC
jgi:hypothetical protein